MTHTNAVIIETKRRLEHLRNLPETPIRLREIQSLERILVASATMKNSPQETRKKATRAKKLSLNDDDDDDDDESKKSSQPERKVEHNGTHRRVTIRKIKEERNSDKEDEAELKKEHDQRIKDIQSTIGLRYRGFS